MKQSHRNTSQRVRVAGALALLAAWPTVTTVEAGLLSWNQPGVAAQSSVRAVQESGVRSSAPRVILVSRKAAPVAPTSTAPTPPPPPPAPPTSVSAVVAWDPNAESDLMGYKLYVGTSSGVYGAPIDVGNFTDYEVRNLEPGRTYYFSVTAYDLSGNESGLADEISNTLSTTSISCTRDAAGVLVCSNG